MWGSERIPGEVPIDAKNPRQRCFCVVLNGGTYDISRGYVQSYRSLPVGLSYRFSASAIGTQSDTTSSVLLSPRFPLAETSRPNHRQGECCSLKTSDTDRRPALTRAKLHAT